MIPRHAYNMFTGTPVQRDESDAVQCPTCLKAMEKVPKRRLTYQCFEHGMFRIKRKQKQRVKDMTDSNNWKATCHECGGIMDYYNLRYGCRKCGAILEV